MALAMWALSKALSNIYIEIWYSIDLYLTICTDFYNVGGFGLINRIFQDPFQDPVL
jgi:hypothetical protein